MLGAYSSAGSRKVTRWQESRDTHGAEREVSGFAFARTTARNPGAVAREGSGDDEGSPRVRVRLVLVRSRVRTHGGNRDRGSR